MFNPGTVVGGRYRLVHLLGEGGMAAVWKAEHMTLGSPVAIKFLQTSGRDLDQLTTRFINEARVAASVRHRNVVKIDDFGLLDDTMPYMVMEYLEGETLADVLEVTPLLETSEAIRIVSLTLRGLSSVHDAGIVHRDLKPENIYLVTDPDGRFPKLLDFGVSKYMGVSTNMTQEGILIGTPDYMSPEQARGQRDLDVRTDIYSAGVLLFELITGRLPFVSDNMGDLIMMITTQRAPSMKSLSPEVSDELCHVVERAMARDRDDRFSDAREMRAALMDSTRTLFPDRDSGINSTSEVPPAGDLSYPHRLPAGIMPGSAPVVPPPAKLPAEAAALAAAPPLAAVAPAPTAQPAPAPAAFAPPPPAAAPPRRSYPEPTSEPVGVTLWPWLLLLLLGAAGLLVAPFFVPDLPWGPLVTDLLEPAPINGSAAPAAVALPSEDGGVDAERTTDATPATAQDAGGMDDAARDAGPLQEGDAARPSLDGSVDAGEADGGEVDSGTTMRRRRGRGRRARRARMRRGHRSRMRRPRRR